MRTSILIAFGATAATHISAAPCRIYFLDRRISSRSRSSPWIWKATRAISRSALWPLCDSLLALPTENRGAQVSFKEAVSALLIDLEDRGLLENTLVVMVGEFGRSPRVSGEGRDHWPACYTAMMAGGGIRGGAVYGSSDKTAAYVKDSPVHPEDFGATLFHALGVPPETRLSPDGFTLPVSAGQPVMELFG